MTDTNNTFQLVVLGIFIISAVVGVILFSLNSSNQGPSQSVTVWGSLDEGVFKSVVSSSGISGTFNVSYVFVEAGSLERELTEALAEGVAPDLVVYPHEYLLEIEDRLLSIPFSSYPERSYRDTFVDGSYIFLKEDGAHALPVGVDPLVMYWNKTLYTNGGFVEPPRFWDELPRYIDALTKRDGVDLRTAGFALGSYSNISSAKDILSALFLQASVPIVEYNKGQYKSNLHPQSNKTASDSVLRFFTEFSNPSKPVYSWNSAMPDSRTAFLRGDLATYFGYASEFTLLFNSNPNLVFDVSVIPQVRDANRVTYGKFWGISVVQNTQNIDSAFAFLGPITGYEAGRAFAEAANLTPLRRDILGVEEGDPYREVFNGSAVISRAWYDPNPRETNQVFRQLVQSISSGGVRISDAVFGAEEMLNTVIDSL